MRNILVHAGRNGRRIVPAFIATAFAQDDAGTARRARYMTFKNHRPIGDDPAGSLSAFANCPGQASSRW
jgi:hypothetical protein